MTTLLTVGDSEGARRCDAKCHNAQEPECDCVCGGRYHGAGERCAFEAARQDILSGVLGDEAAAVARAVLESGVQQSLFPGDERSSPAVSPPSSLQRPDVDPRAPDPPIAPASDRPPDLGIDMANPTSKPPAPAGQPNEDNMGAGSPQGGLRTQPGLATPAGKQSQIKPDHSRGCRFAGDDRDETSGVPGVRQRQLAGENTPASALQPGAAARPETRHNSQQKEVAYAAVGGKASAEEPRPPGVAPDDDGSPARRRGRTSLVGGHPTNDMGAASERGRIPIKSVVRRAGEPASAHPSPSPANPGAQDLPAADVPGGAAPTSEAPPCNPTEDPRAADPGSGGRSSRGCATPGCGRPAHWGSTRCSGCDPWRTMVSLRGLGARA